MQVAETLQNAGAAAVTIHGRTMEQRYKRAADWGLVQQAANHLTVPVIGNGDVLTYYEVNMHGHAVSMAVLSYPAGPAGMPSHRSVYQDPTAQAGQFSHQTQPTCTLAQERNLLQVTLMTQVCSIADTAWSSRFNVCNSTGKVNTWPFTLSRTEAQTAGDLVLLHADTLYP